MATKSEKTREAILNTSYALFAEKGFKQVTMKDVCEATNMSRGGLYSHFSSTSLLFEALLQKITEKDALGFQERIEKKDSATAILEDTLNRMEDEMKHPEASLSLAMYEYAETVDSDLMERLNKDSEKKWKNLIRYGIDRGEFRDVNISGIVNVILFSYQGVRMWSRIIPMKPETFRLIVDHVKNQLIGG
jgi:AcrR family transcriptional regulator